MYPIHIHLRGIPEAELFLPIEQTEIVHEATDIERRIKETGGNKRFREIAEDLVFIYKITKGKK